MREGGAREGERKKEKRSEKSIIKVVDCHISLNEN